MRRVVPLCLALAVGLLAMHSDGTAQEVAPISAVAVEQVGSVLPRNTPVYLTLNETLTTKSKKTKQGSRFTLSVARNVVMQRHVVIPRGSRAVGTVVYRTRKGGFGKSGKMEVSLDYIEVGDQQIPIQGQHREEGEGNTTATVATAFFSILGSGLITGHSAEIPAGREFTAWTKEDVPVRLPGVDSSTPDSTPGILAAEPLPSSRAPADNSGKKAMPQLTGRVRCVTC